MASTALTDRSIRTIRTELEFLQTSNIITPAQLSQHLALLPAEGAVPSPPTPEPSSNSPAPPTYTARAQAEALWTFQDSQHGSLNFQAGDRLEIIEKVNDSWWQGKNLTRGSGGEEGGLFPANYVRELPPQTADVKSAPPLPPRTASPYGAPPPPPVQNNAYGYQQQPQYPPPQGGGAYGYPGMQQPPPQQLHPYQYQQQQYAQQQPQYTPPQHLPFPPPAGPPPQPPAGPAEEPAKESAFKKHGKSIGGKFGNAAIFGAGATAGSNLINSIF